METSYLETSAASFVPCSCTYYSSQQMVKYWFTFKFKNAKIFNTAWIENLVEKSTKKNPYK